MRLKEGNYLMRLLFLIFVSFHSILPTLCLPLSLSLFLSLALFPDEGVWDSFIRLIPPSSRSVTIPLERLRSGISYEFRVIAINRYGYGQPSAPTAALAGNYTWQRALTYTPNMETEIKLF